MWRSWLREQRLSTIGSSTVPGGKLLQAASAMTEESEEFEVPAKSTAIGIVPVPAPERNPRLLQ